MNELDELKEEYRRLGEKIKALEWWSKDGFWYIGADRICNTRSYPVNIDGENWHRAQGNFFRTKEEVYREVEYRKVIGKLLLCKGRVPFRAKTINYCMVFNFTSMNISTTSFDYNACGIFNIYFESSQAVNAAIKEVGKDRIIDAAKWQATRPVY